MPTLLDQYGNPIKLETASLEEPQTSKLMQLQQEFAGHPSRGLTPAKLARILDGAEQGDIQAQHDLFLDMEEKDGHIFAEMSKRRRALLGIDWSIEPPRNATAQEQRTTEELTEWFNDIPDIEDLILDMADAIGHGFACLELEWQLNQNIHLPMDIDHRPQSWFMLDRETRSELRLRDSAMGQPLQQFSWIVHTHRAKPGYLSRAGLHRALAWPYLFKTYSIGDLAELLEIYGMPIKVGKFPTSATEDEKATLLRALVGIGHNAAGIIPEGMLIEFQNAAQGNNDLFESMINWCERTQSKAILGATLTSGTGDGTNTNALGNVHNDVRQDLRDSDARQLEGTITRDLLYPILAINGRIENPRRYPSFRFDTKDPADIKLMSEAIPELVDVGFQIPLKWAQEQKLRIPLPEKDEPILARASLPQPVGEPLKGIPKGEIPAILKADPPPPDPLDKVADRLQADAADPLRGLLDRISGIVNQADDMEQLQRQLLQAYNHLDTKRLAEVMRIAYATAELAGRVDVQNGQ